MRAAFASAIRLRLWGCTVLALLLLALCAVAWMRGPLLRDWRHERQRQLVEEALLRAQAVAFWLRSDTHAAGRLVLDISGAEPLPRWQSGVDIPQQLRSVAPSCFDAAAVGRPLAPPFLQNGEEYLLFCRPLPDGGTEQPTAVEFLARRVAPLRQMLATSASDVVAALRLETSAAPVLLHAPQVVPEAAVRHALDAAAAGHTSVAAADTAPNSQVSAAAPETTAFFLRHADDLWLAFAPVDEGSQLVLALRHGDAPLAAHMGEAALCLAALLVGGGGLLWWVSQPLKGKVLLPLTVRAEEEAQRRHLETACRAAQHSLAAQSAQRRQLAGQLIDMLEGMRQALARELHDNAGQMLTTLLLTLEAGRATPAAAVTENASLAVRQIQDAVRHMARGLRPPALDVLGLTAALEGLCEDFRQAGLDVRFFHDAVPALEAARALALFRVAQEALTNTLKHAGASQAHVSLTGRASCMVLTVEDNGRGFLPPAEGAAREAHAPGGLGLALMRERMAQWGGTLTLDARPGGGTLVMAELPL